MKKKDYDQFMRHCQVIQKLSQDKTLLKVKQTQQLIVLKYIHNATNDLIPILSQQKQINNQHLESVIDYYQASYNTIAVFTQYSTHTLEQQIIARRKLNTRFSYQELQNILISVLKALNYLESKSIGHGCISMKDIVISSSGIVKLIDPCLATSSPFNLISGYYYSPELLQFNSLKNFNKTTSILQESQGEGIDFFKNDMFVLAFLIIQAGLLHSNLEQCILYDTGNIDFELLSNYFNQFQCLFPNEPFINLLHRMLQQDSNIRINTKQALKYIQQTFESQQGDQDQSQISDSSCSSNMLQSKEKTLHSFLLSQGPISSMNSSLKSSQLVQSSVKTNKFTINKNNKMGSIPLIRC